MKNVIKIIGFIAALFVWVTFAYTTLDRSLEAQKATGGGYIPHKATFFILSAIILLFFRNQIFTRRISVGNIISKIVFALTLLFAVIGLTVTKQFIPDNEIQTFVDTFESNQIARKPKEMMELFTPPANEVESKQYAFIMGQDINGPRLFLTNGLQDCIKSYKIVNTKQTESGVNVIVNENRCRKDNTSGNVSYADVKLILELKRTGLNIVIDKYYSANSDKTKYQGLYE